MIKIEETIDILGIDLLGVVPDDEKIVVSTNKGEPVVTVQDSLAGQAFGNIARRLMGEDIPVFNLEKENTIMDRLRKFFGKNGKKRA